MDELHEGFIQFWEILTGVFDDERSKLLRILCFLMLFLGCVWAALNYFKAERIANLNEEFESPVMRAQHKRKNEALEKLMAAAQTVGTMRRGGEAIAKAISEMNTRPFNLDGYDEYGIEDLSGVTEFAPDSQAAQQQEEEKKEMPIKALMVSGKTRYAVIDYAGSQGIVIRQGQKLPDGRRIVRITPQGITVRTENKQEFTYTIND